MPFLSEPYDLAIDIGCMHALVGEDRRAYAHEGARLVRPGGRYILFAHLRDQETADIPVSIPRTLLLNLFTEYFTLDEVRPAADWHCGGDDRCHFLAVLEGEARLPARWGLPAVAAGDCVLLPATAGAQEIAAAGAKLLHVAVP
jgi:hypothetical protein